MTSFCLVAVLTGVLKTQRLLRTFRIPKPELARIIRENSGNSGRNTHFATSISKKRCYFANGLRIVDFGFRILLKSDSKNLNLNSKIHIPKSEIHIPKSEI